MRFLPRVGPVGFMGRPVGFGSAVRACGIGVPARTTARRWACAQDSKGLGQQRIAADARAHHPSGLQQLGRQRFLGRSGVLEGTVYVTNRSDPVVGNGQGSGPAPCRVFEGGAAVCAGGRRVCGLCRSGGLLRPVH